MLLLVLLLEGSESLEWISRGLNGMIPVGGNFRNNFIEADKELWKKLQKKDYI